MNVPVVELLGTNVIITSPLIEDGFVMEAFVALSFTSIIFHVPSKDVETASEALFLHEKNITPINVIRRIESFMS